MSPQLTAAAACRRDATETERRIVACARQLGIGWEAIGAALAMTGDEARERYGDDGED